VVGDIAAGDLRTQPFAHIAFGAAGPLGDLARGERTGIGHRLVEAELVADADHHTAITGRDVGDRTADHRVELGGIDRLSVDMVHVQISCSTG
jgi:hypothetical protein